MSNFIRRLCTQVATYWAPSATPFNTYGDPAFLAPVVLDPATFTGVRWEDKTDEMITTKTGDQQQSKAIVWSAATTFKVGGFLFLGSSAASNPTTVAGAHIILQTSDDISLYGENFSHKAWL